MNWMIFRQLRKTNVDGIAMVKSSDISQLPEFVETGLAFQRTSEVLQTMNCIYIGWLMPWPFCLILFFHSLCEGLHNFQICAVFCECLFSVTWLRCLRCCNVTDVVAKTQDMFCNHRLHFVNLIIKILFLCVWLRISTELSCSMFYNFQIQVFVFR